MPGGSGTTNNDIVAEQQSWRGQCRLRRPTGERKSKVAHRNGTNRKLRESAAAGESGTDARIFAPTNRNDRRVGDADSRCRKPQSDSRSVKWETHRLYPLLDCPATEEVSRRLTPMLADRMYSILSARSPTQQAFL